MKRKVVIAILLITGLCIVIVATVFITLFAEHVVTTETGDAWGKRIYAGDEAQKAGNYIEAEKQFVEALQEAKMKGLQSHETAATLNYMGDLYRVTDRYPKAEKAFNDAIAIFKKNGEIKDMAWAIGNLGQTYLDQQQWEKAEATLKRHVSAMETASNKQDADVADALTRLGSYYVDQEIWKQAEPVLTRAVAVWEKAGGEPSSAKAIALNGLGEIKRGKSLYKDAMELYQKALVVWEKTDGAGSPEAAAALNNIGLTHLEEGNPQLGEPYLQKALAIWSESKDKRESIALYNLWLTYDKMGDRETANKYREREQALGKQ